MLAPLPPAALLVQAMGIALDDAKNEAAVGGVQADISGPGASTRVLVVPTDEELAIAQQTLEVVAGLHGGKHGAAVAA